MEIPAFNLDLTDSKTLFRVDRVDDTLEAIPVMGVPHTHNCYAISILLRGVYTSYAQLEPRQVAAPALVLLDKDEVHIHGPYQQLELVSVSFTEWLLSTVARDGYDWQQLFATPVIPLTEAQLAEMMPYVELLEAEYQRSPQPEAPFIAGHLVAILLKLAHTFRPASDAETHPSRLYKAFNEQLHAHYRTRTAVQEYAELLHVSESQLQQAVRAATGKSPKHLIDERRLMEAKRLLYWAQLPAKEIAWQLGFVSPQYFNRFFKKHTGLAPLAFRQAVAQKGN